MKLKCFFLSVFVLGFALANAQSVVKGNKIINVGIGLGTTYYSGDFYTSSVPPLTVSMEYIFKDGVADGKGAWGIGGYFGYAAYKWEQYYHGYGSWGYSANNVFIGPRCAFHYSFVDKLDTYGGIFLGYDVVKVKEFGTVYPGYTYIAGNSGFVWSLYVGGRYFFSEKFAGMLELGYGISYLNLGVAVKL